MQPVSPMLASNKTVGTRSKFFITVITPEFRPLATIRSPMPRAYVSTDNRLRRRERKHRATCRMLERPLSSVKAAFDYSAKQFGNDLTRKPSTERKRVESGK